MRKCDFITGCICLLCAEFLSAQQLRPFVVSASGGFDKSTAGMLSYSVGEIASIETYTTSSVILTQGFQQAWDFSTAIAGHPGYDFSFYIYPNPAEGLISLITEGDTYVYVDIRISDVLGRERLRTSFVHQHGHHAEPLDLLHLPSGMYTMKLSVKESNNNPEDHFIQKLLVIR